MKWLVLIVCLGHLSVGAKARDSDDARIVAKRSTKTAIILTTSTTIRPYTCALTVNAPVCQRRRFKRYTPIEDERIIANEAAQLEGSLAEYEKGANTDFREPRIALTFISTTSSTYTVTVTSTNTAITFSLSYYCTVNGASYPPRCG
ncbi:uncharacterized protein [Procambarus clarkii]|uniref:uncharacterized protein n=1 Tax=Procambarus clarkii TaxID=6728 RepID=UPI001E677048|nr:uncharacterized protein LOC123763036 [Procambarus clarkii]